MKRSVAICRKRASAEREGVGQQRALHRNGREDAGTGERDDPEQLPPVERRGAERKREHRDREEPAQHARTVRGRAVGEVPERLRDERDGEAGQHRDQDEPAEAEVVLARDVRSQ
jgi:hypothetical protein